ncbi:MAG: cob(I)yrinic acid a,c-diamide adenosyltransferase [Hydrogenoanaerobacterium sp.]
MADKTGLIHIYCGDGKGKTTAAIGLAVRAAGAGFKVVLVQFLKGQQSSELLSLALLPNITLLREKLSPKFSFQMDDTEKAETIAVHGHYLKTAAELCKEKNCDVLVLDEVLGALDCGLLDTELLRRFIDQKPDELELVLTGRNPPQWLCEKADYISEIHKVKHPFDAGIQARIGIEK